MLAGHLAGGAVDAGNIGTTGSKANAGFALLQVRNDVLRDGLAHCCGVFMLAQVAALLHFFECFCAASGFKVLDDLTIFRAVLAADLVHFCSTARGPFHAAHCAAVVDGL